MHTANPAAYRNSWNPC